MMFVNVLYFIFCAGHGASGMRKHKIEGNQNDSSCKKLLKEFNMMDTASDSAKQYGEAWQKRTVCKLVHACLELHTAKQEAMATLYQYKWLQHAIHLNCVCDDSVRG